MPDKKNLVYKAVYFVVVRQRGNDPHPIYQKLANLWESLLDGQPGIGCENPQMAQRVWA